jgi:hypothetical protein
MAEWANDVPESAQTPARQLEALTLHASAETALRNFSNALAIDRALAGEVTAAARRSARSVLASTETERSMDLVQALDALVLQQDAIGRQLEQVASTSGAVGALAERERKLSEVLAAILKSAGLPGEGSRLTAARNCLAMDAVLQALPKLAGAADRARLVEQLDQPTQQLQRTVDDMKRYLGASAAVCQTMDTRVLPMLQQIMAWASGDSENAVDEMELNRIANEMHPMLLEAGEGIVEADALSVAQFHARRASEMLSRKSVEFGPTLRETSAALVGLKRAWDEAVHRAALARVVRLPALAKALWDEPAERGQRESDAARGVAPKGFEDSVNAYFEAMNPGSEKTPASDE